MCEYCGGALVRARIAIGNGHHQTPHIEVIRCERCGCEPSTLCGICETRTEPCPVCHMQRCLCIHHRTKTKLHYMGGRPVTDSAPSIDLAELGRIDEQRVATYRAGYYQSARRNGYG